MPRRPAAKGALKLPQIPKKFEARLIGYLDAHRSWRNKFTLSSVAWMSDEAPYLRALHAVRQDPELMAYVQEHAKQIELIKTHNTEVEKRASAARSDADRKRILAGLINIPRDHLDLHPAVMRPHGWMTLDKLTQYGSHERSRNSALDLEHMGLRDRYITEEANRRMAESGAQSAAGARQKPLELEVPQRRADLEGRITEIDGEILNLERTHELIGLGEPAPPMLKLKRAERAKLEKLLAKNPGGSDTELGQRSTSNSGGAGKK